MRRTAQLAVTSLLALGAALCIPAAANANGCSGAGHRSRRDVAAARPGPRE